MTLAHTPPLGQVSSCQTRRPVAGIGRGLTMAFQPIADLHRRTLFGYESLVRGRAGEAADAVLAGIAPDDRPAFDRACWATAFALARRLGVSSALAVNAWPSSLLGGGVGVIALTAERYGFSPAQVVVELTEQEAVADPTLVREAVGETQAAGMRVALDDLGAGYASLTLLVDLSPDLVKLDRGLIRGIDVSPFRRSVVRGLLGVCLDRQVAVIAEGVETAGEFATVRDMGVRYVQGFLIGRPGFETLPPVHWPATAA